MPDRFELQLNNRFSPAYSISSSGSGLLMLNMFFMMPGLLVCLVALHMYPPLDPRMPWAFMLGVYLLPVAVHLLTWILMPASMAARPWRKVYISACLVLVMFSAFLFLNGRMDRSQASQVSTTVVRKNVYRGRHGTSYNLVVTSWRPGRNFEYFGVGESAYDRAQVGKTATVEMHKGYFGLAWHGPISPE
ncbi:MAG TPA: hypothetical protein VNM47_04765 [Terriglobia bacterium]|nr:hypothetical protein [Terriglobia bacterium]